MGNLQTATKPVESEATQTISTSITTWNGAESYASVHDPLVELFFKSVRDIPCTDYRCITVKKSKKEAKKRGFSTSSGPKSLEHYFDAAWTSDPLRTLKFVFYLRDCRGGKGERKLFRALVRHMRERGLSAHLEANIDQVPFFGSWKDVSICFFGTPQEERAIELISNQLRQDKDAERPSLCAKYAPSEGGAVDKAHRAATKVASDLGVSLTRYRKGYLVPLRAKLNIVERDMCAGEWAGVEYEKIPSIAGSRYKKAFNKHDEARYTEYLRGVQRGEKKMNTSVLMPYQIVSPYIKGENRDETIEAQWKSFIDNRRTKWPAGINVMPLVDVSGSMFNGATPAPGEVAVSLGMLFAELNSSPQYKGKFMTFSSTPELLTVKGGSLHEQVNYVKGTHWEMTTDFQKALDLLLTIATTFNIPQADMPQILLVISDMQFNEAQRGQSNWDVLEHKYNEAGYTRPTIIFWNLNGNSMDYPVPNASVPNCALLSGFNDSIMYSILDGVMPNPLAIVHKALDKERYDVIRLAD
ncbi:Domain of unknown function (DUF2828)-containing protein [uncultured virus]|nr:Domain of unknown function (DUF2828)-containing protein [uncultured virus]